ncbi:Chemotaxis response regulator protein-glutamate methylesterase [Planctomycetes bacterium Pla163]|uniref:Protein-glutamate methylesterase/protein-glutamine glutaminase n=1 Tax=Rohdeia mirabilis TaxID=2528008 RepID=A0A518CVV5_9BACT|nr:Chemotaxis response regulator protein-glutamate methylesterase [Planctomycetes bacterium Pla163]
MSAIESRRHRKPIRLLVVDDSALLRKTVARMLEDVDDIEIVATARDPFEAREMLAAERPDVMLLDVEMPRMDGMTFLQKVMQHRPMPVVMFSARTEEGGELAMRALEIGALDVVCKPGGSNKPLDVKERLVDAVRAAGGARLRTANTPVDSVPAPMVTERRSGPYKRSIIAIGASTGGTEATNQVLRTFGPEDPGILIVQHMGAHFMAAYAERLNANHRIEVKIAEEGDIVRPGLALVAPGDRHMGVRKQGRGYRVHMIDTEKVHHQRPAIDVTFNSLAACARADAVAVLLTGMGQDGAQGMLAMKKAGALTLAQDQESCVVYGMPRVAAEIGAVDRVCGLTSIGQQSLRAAAQ